MPDLTLKLKRRFGVSKVYHRSGYVNDPRQENIVNIIESAAKLNRLIPSYVCTIAIGEGFGLWIDDNYGPKAVNIDKSIDGFEYLGLDHFGADFNRTKKYLPEDYNRGDDYEDSNAVNEHGLEVQSAGFKNVKSGIQALHIVCALINLLVYSAASATAIGSCLAGTGSSNKEASVSKMQARETSEISQKFRIALQNKGYTVHSPEEIKKPEVVDNIKRVKSLFNNKDIIFFSYLTLNRYAIYKGKDRIRARLYCFQFKNNEQAYRWFEVIDNSRSEGHRRLVVFSKPKKLLALAGDRVYLLEGYHISGFDSLYFIINQLENLEYILGPTETSKIK